MSARSAFNNVLKEKLNFLKSLGATQAFSAAAAISFSDFFLQRPSQLHQL